MLLCRVYICVAAVGRVSLNSVLAAYVQVFIQAAIMSSEQESRLYFGAQRGAE